MAMIARTTALLLTMSLAALSGCREEPTGTRGQLGNLRFAYSVPGTCEACAIDRELLAGSLVGMDVRNINHKVHYQVRSSAPEIAEFYFTPRCRYVGQVDCQESVIVETKKAGDADLVVFDEWTETILDRVTIKVRDAARIETTVKATPSPSRDGSTADVDPSPDGVFELTVDSDVELVSVARSADGAELLAAGGAIRGIYTNEQIVGPRPVFVGAAATEYARAKTPGVTTVAVAGSGVRHELAFRVVR